MCFEFEWLYWAQMAQEEEQRRKDAANRIDAQSNPQLDGLHADAMAIPTASLADAQRQDQRKPLHA
jgi:hypothetical protein